MEAQTLINRAENIASVIVRKAEQRTERELDNGERFAELQLEIASDMRAALIGVQSFVPSYQTRSHVRVVDGEDEYTYTRHEKLSNPMQEVLETLEHNDCAQAFSDILRRSQCPLVAKLRELIVSRYVAETAEGLAEARGL